MSDNESDGDHVYVFSLATVPDVEAYAAINNLDGMSADDVREALGDKSEKPVYHAIVALGGVLAHRAGAASDEDGDDASRGPWAVSSVAVSSVAHESEEEIVTGFADCVSALKPRLFTFDGTGFDITVLRYRGIAHHVRAHFLFAPEGSPDAIVDIGRLCAAGGGGKKRLHTLCREMGIRRGRDVFGWDGGDPIDAETLYRSGRVDQLVRRCERDSIDAYRLWLRHQLSNGHLSEPDFWASEEALRRYVTALEAGRASLPQVA
ncbi:hypothetical protein A33M_3205 [Rhodovulum sp. PH10]|uniref:hypothetical protein n=1 Tax=Rhodovulum sp. PH10 TaxID=1187851 RepID=UPI00027C2525|nr:hypothetical protein [Rhodovulum sp. PH10]EJW11371.1 hypothetical protein A33M_3205 [Rhodovulum sp. PH10]